MHLFLLPDHQFIQKNCRSCPLTLQSAHREWNRTVEQLTFEPRQHSIASPASAASASVTGGKETETQTRRKTISLSRSLRLLFFFPLIVYSNTINTRFQHRPFPPWLHSAQSCRVAFVDSAHCACWPKPYRTKQSRVAVSVTCKTTPNDA